MSTRTVLAFGGAAIGAIAGPTGARIGFAIGSMIGGIVDPQVIQGPKLSDGSVQTSRDGQPIAIVYGRGPVVGTLVEVGPDNRIVQRKRQGKGGGPVTETERLRKTFAILICENGFSGSIAGIARVWEDDKLVYDPVTIPAESAKFMRNTRFLLGGEDQMPDPAIEAFRGVGTTPAYRGHALMVRDNQDITDNGLRIPQYRFDVIASGLSYTSNIMRDRPIAYWPLNDVDGTAVEMVNGFNGEYVGSYSHGPAINAGNTGSAVFTDNTGSVRVPRSSYGTALDVGNTLHWSVEAVFQPTQANPDVVFQSIVTHWRSTFSGTTNFSLLLRDLGSNLTPRGDFTSSGGINVAAVSSSPVGVNEVHHSALVRDGNDLRLYVDGSLVDTANAAGLSSSAGDDSGISIGGNSYPPDTFPASYGFIGHVSDVAVYDYSLTQAQIVSHFTSAAIDPTWLNLPDVSGGYVTQEGEVIDHFLTVTKLIESPATLRDIQLNLLTRVNIATAKADVSALTDICRGFVVAKQMTCAEASQSLQTAYSYDLGDWDRQLHSVKRGGPVLYTVTDNDLLDQDGFAEAGRDQSLEHPRKIHVFAYGPDYNYVPNKQTAERYSPDVLSNSEVSIELPLVLTADEQAKAADRFLKVSDAESNGGIQLKLWNKFLFATVTDVFAYNGKRYRIDAINNQMGQVEIADAKIDRQSAYTSDLTGIPAPAPVTPTPALAGPTLFAALNLPFLRTEDSVPGMYFAARGILPGWPGCDVQMSSDGGLSYSTLTQITNPAIIGVLTADVTSSSEPLSVRLYGDDLSTISPGQLVAGGNAFVVTSAGVSEIAQFLTATETSDLHFDLTGLVRGQLDTIAAAHLIGDQFVFLDAVVFVPIDAGLIGQTLLFRPVTLGTIEDNNATVSVVYQGQEVIYDGGQP